MPAKKDPAAKRRAAATPASLRDAVLAEHMARVQHALHQQAELLTAFAAALQRLTLQTAQLSAQLAALKRQKKGARRSR